MTKSRAALLGLALVALFLFPGIACKPEHSYDWRVVYSADGKSKISFPGNPILEETPTKSITGGSFTLHSLKIKPVESAAYGCSWWEDPSLNSLSVEERLNKARDNGVGGVGGRLISETRISVQGYPARDIRAIARGNAAFDSRVILVGSRLYTLMVIDVSGNHDTKNVERFFNSFTLR
jgi:hypothetical protein